MKVNSIRQRQYRQLIIDRSQHPKNKGKTKVIHCYGQKENLRCGDKIELTIKFGMMKEIEDVKFEGTGCALCIASTDLMVDAVRTKTIDEAILLSKHFHQMISNGIGSEASLGKLSALIGVSRYPSKVGCVILPWEVLLALFQKVSK